MNFTFMAPGVGLCLVTLWATGRYGFSLPKKVEISTPEGMTSTYLYFNRKLRLEAELSNRAIVKIAVARFLAGAVAMPMPVPVPAPVELDPEMQAFDGELTQVRNLATRAPMRVRPGKGHARTRAVS